MRHQIALRWVPVSPAGDEAMLRAACLPSAPDEFIRLGRPGVNPTPGRPPPLRPTVDASQAGGVPHRGGGRARRPGGCPHRARSARCRDGRATPADRRLVPAAVRAHRRRSFGGKLATALVDLALGLCVLSLLSSVHVGTTSVPRWAPPDPRPDRGSYR